MAELLSIFNVPSGAISPRKNAAWQKASPIPGRPPHLERIDCDFRAMRWLEYGMQSKYGWKVDHIVPVAGGGTDDLSNLRARHWRGNRSAGAILSEFLSGLRRRTG